MYSFYITFLCNVYIAVKKIERENAKYARAYQWIQLKEGMEPSTFAFFGSLIPFPFSCFGWYALPYFAFPLLIFCPLLLEEAVDNPVLQH